MRMKILKVLLAFLLIALIPIPAYTTVFPFNSIGADFVAAGVMGVPDGSTNHCAGRVERWAGLLIGIEISRTDGEGCYDKLRYYGLKYRCERETWGRLDGRDMMGAWAVPLGETYISVAFGVAPYRSLGSDPAISERLVEINLASSGFGISFRNYFYPDLLTFGDCSRFVSETILISNLNQEIDHLRRYASEKLDESWDNYRRAVCGFYERCRECINDYWLKLIDVKEDPTEEIRDMFDYCVDKTFKDVCENCFDGIQYFGIDYGGDGYE
jgi:hypothetical protein